MSCNISINEIKYKRNLFNSRKNVEIFGIKILSIVNNKVSQD
jgi:hypothetical protein